MQHWEIWEVVEKETGKLIKIKDYRFDSHLYDFKRKAGYGGQERPNVLAYTTDCSLPEIKVEQVVEPEAVNEELVEENEGTKYFCEPCSKEFKREQDFKTHNTKYHSE